MRRRKTITPDIPMTSTADVAFLLLIFFLVAASNTQDRGRELDLPGTVKAAQQEGKNLEIALSRDAITVAGEVIDPAELEPIVRNRLKDASEPAQRVVLITSGDGVDYQMWTDVVTAVESAGGIPSPQIEEESP